MRSQNKRTLALYYIFKFFHAKSNPQSWRHHPSGIEAQVFGDEAVHVRTLVNDALKASLQEDVEDIKSWEERKGEDTYSYEEFLGLLKKEQVI